MLFQSVVCVSNTTAYDTSRSSDLDTLKPSSWLMIRLQRDFLPRPLTSSRDEAQAGKQKVTFFCAKRQRERRHQVNSAPSSSDTGAGLV